MTDFRVLVTGSRTWTDGEALRDVLGRLLAEHGTLTVVHGNARTGADKIAHDWALSQHYASSCGAVTPEAHPADWQKHGKAAGYRRNEEMVALGADLCLAFLMPCRMLRCASRTPHPTHGTAHCAGLAERAGIPVRRVTA